MSEIGIFSTIALALWMRELLEHFGQFSVVVHDEHHISIFDEVDTVGAVDQIGRPRLGRPFEPV